jgi:hypothetical protein
MSWLSQYQRLTYNTTKAVTCRLCTGFIWVTKLFWGPSFNVKGPWWCPLPSYWATERRLASRLFPHISDMLSYSFNFRHSRGSALVQPVLRLEVGSSRTLPNVGTLWPDYTSSHPRRHDSESPGKDNFVPVSKTTSAIKMHQIIHRKT